MASEKVEPKSEKKETSSAAPASLIDHDWFWKRIKKIYDAWKGKHLVAPANNAVPDALLIVKGENDEEILYQRSYAMQLWLLNVFSHDTIILMTESEILIVTSEKKAAALSVLNPGEHGLGLTIRIKNKADKYVSDYDAIVRAIQGSKAGKRVGTLPKDNEKAKGGFGAPLTDALQKAGLELVDLSQGFGQLLAVRDEQELDCMRKSADASAQILKKYLLGEVETVIDEEKKVKHSDLAEQTDVAITDPAKIKLSLRRELLESCYTPIIMSGGKYDLRPSAQSNDDLLSFDTIILQLGVRYKNYCTNVGRTYFINATENQKEMYGLLTEVYAVCKAAMRADQKLSKVWEVALQAIKQKNESLVNNFVKNCGFGIGLEFRDASLVLNKDNARVFKAGMVFNLCVGFENLKTKDGKTYAVLLADTVLIQPDGEPDVLTHLPRSFKEVTYQIDDGNNDDNADVADMDVDEVIDISKPRQTRNAASGASAARPDVAQSTEAKIRENQRELAKQNQEEGLRRFRQSGSKGADGKENKKASDEKVECYKSPAEFPAQAKAQKLYVDQKAECVLVPVYGQIVPFHISMIRNVNKTETGGFTYLRINFMTPDMAFNASQKLSAAISPNQFFVQELTFRSKSKSLDSVFQNINELRRRVQARLKESEEKKTLVEQEELILARPDKVYRLRDVQIKPQQSRGKSSGTIEVHVNGIRFTSTKNDRLSVTYKNMKHAFFQKATPTTLSVILHLSFHNPIMIGKKKSDYVQFYFDVVDASQDLDARARANDEDGLLEEKRERELRERWNKKFKDLVTEMEASAKAYKVALDFDSPYMQLGFEGVAAKEQVNIYPTVHCLVALEDNPPMVITLDDVEIACLERVQFSLRSFDLAFIFKDFDRPVVRIDSIPSKYVDNIKDWLNSCNILFFESKINIIWKNILREIKKDPQAFYEEGGWSHLADDEEFAGEDGVAGEEEDEEAAESASEYTESEAESEEESSEEYESSEEVSEDDESEASDASSEEAEDWDELEKQAARDDKEKRRRELERDEAERSGNPKKRAKK